MSRQPCADLSSVVIGLTFSDHDRGGLYIVPLGGTDPLGAESEGYGIRPLEIDATEHVTIPFFTDGRSLNFGLRLVPVSRTGARGDPVDIWIKEPALPGMAQFLHRNGWIASSAIAVLLLALATVLLGMPRLRRGGRGLTRALRRTASKL